MLAALTLWVQDQTGNGNDAQGGNKTFTEEQLGLVCMRGYCRAQDLSIFWSHVFKKL